MPRLLEHGSSKRDPICIFVYAVKLSRFISNDLWRQEKETRTHMPRPNGESLAIEWFNPCNSSPAVKVLSLHGLFSSSFGGKLNIRNSGSHVVLHLQLASVGGPWKKRVRFTNEFQVKTSSQQSQISQYAFKNRQAIITIWREQWMSIGAAGSILMC